MKYCAYGEKKGTVLTFRRHRRRRTKQKPKGTSSRAKKEEELGRKGLDAEERSRRTKTRPVGGGNPEEEEGADEHWVAHSLGSMR
jgi:hypothetical protein